MNIGRIGNIKKTFLDKKEILNVKDFSYAPLSKDSLDKAIGVLSAVSSALFIANVTMNTTTKMDNSNEDYITEQELIKILDNDKYDIVHFDHCMYFTIRLKKFDGDFNILNLSVSEYCKKFITTQPRINILNSCIVSKLCF